MKVIDLLNKVASGELNDGFKFVDDNGSEWIYLKNVNKLCEINFATDNNVNGINYNTERIFWIKNLNDEIEIIEEDNPIEKLMQLDTRETSDCIIEIQYKINEIIDKLNKLEEER